VNLADDEARRRLAAARVARLATVAGPGPPHIVPVAFALHGDRIYTAVDAKPKTTRDLRRLRNIRAHPPVAVLADHYEEDWSRLWWARADGTAVVRPPEAEPEERAVSLRALMARYPEYADQPPSGPLILIRVERWSGWHA
jgi:PPOX class probable F420-dependent enzyme